MNNLFDELEEREIVDVQAAVLKIRENRKDMVQTLVCKTNKSFIYPDIVNRQEK